MTPFRPSRYRWMLVAAAPRAANGVQVNESFNFAEQYDVGGMGIRWINTTHLNNE